MILRNEFNQLIKKDNILPVDFCKEVFFHYEMYDEMIQFLLYKNEFNELLSLTKRMFEQSTKDGNREHQKYWLN